jgi:hypothetical protein
MSSNLLNKENSANIFVPRSHSKGSLSVANGVFKDANNLPTNVNRANGGTPKMTECKVNELKDTATNTASKSRRALGDLLNTTNKVSKTGGVVQIGFTPKGDRVSSSFTPLQNVKTKPKCVNNEMPKLAAAVSNEMDTTEPPERFIGNKYDSFDDLFEEGRLTDSFLNKKITFVGNLPNGGHVQADDRIKPMEVDENLSVRQMNKIMKKQAKKMMILTPHELPLLEEPSFTNLLDMLEV